RLPPAGQLAVVHGHAQRVRTGAPRPEAAGGGDGDLARGRVEREPPDAAAAGDLPVAERVMVAASGADGADRAGLAGAEPDPLRGGHDRAVVEEVPCGELHEARPVR